MNCKGLQTNMPQLVGSKEDLISKNIQTSLDPTFCGIFVCGPLQFMPIYLYFGAVGLFYFIDLICCTFCMVCPGMFVILVLSVLYLLSETSTRHFDSYPPGDT